VQGELLHGSPAVCAVQYPLDLHELVLWDVVLLSKVKVIYFARFRTRTAHTLLDSKLQVRTNIDYFSSRTTTAETGLTAEQTTHTSNKASIVSNPARDPSACNSDLGSPFAVPGIVVGYSSSRRLRTRQVVNKDQYSQVEKGRSMGVSEAD